MSKIRIDPLSALVRIYENEIDDSIPLSEMSESYYKTLTLVFLDNGRVRFQGALFSPTLSESREIHEKLKDLGYPGVEWRSKDRERAKNE